MQVQDGMSRVVLVVVPALVAQAAQAALAVILMAAAL